MVITDSRYLSVMSEKKRQPMQMRRKLLSHMLQGLEARPSMTLLPPTTAYVHLNMTVLSASANWPMMSGSIPICGFF